MVFLCCHVDQSLGGGQRKRVNIGLELAARPTVLMLDEPTSGLDASTALEIIRSVKRLTAIGAARRARNGWESERARPVDNHPTGFV